MESEQPSRWADSSKRQITRLYISASLSMAQVRKVFSKTVSSDNHEGEEPVHKKLRSNFDKEPRWVHTKPDADMEARLAKLESMDTRQPVYACPYKKLHDMKASDGDGPQISLGYDLPRGPEMNDNWDGTIDQDLQRPRTWSPSDASLRGIKSFEVPGTINGIPVNALPDWGSAVDAVSEDFAKRYHLEIKRTGAQHIQLLGGHKAESVGQIAGLFKFRGESRAHRRIFHVLRKSMYDVILGRKFLNLTSTLTKNYHRIVEKIRPCIQSKGRLFLLDESPDERIRCTVNGAEASAFPDTGSDLMLVSGDFARRHNLRVRRGRRYRRQVDLIDGSTVLTDGMVLNAELQFNTAPAASREVDYDRYCRFADHLSSITHQKKTDATPRSTFVCDLHVIEGLPCDIILSNEFIFRNHVFSRFKDLFCSMPVAPSSDATVLDRSILFIRNKANKKSWLSRLRQGPDNQEPEPIPLEADTSWEERWVAEESRRNQAQLLIAVLPHSRRSEAQREEDEIRNAWDRENPRPPPTSRLSSPDRAPFQAQVPRSPPPAVPRRPVAVARA